MSKPNIIDYLLSQDPDDPFSQLDLDQFDEDDAVYFANVVLLLSTIPSDVSQRILDKM